MNGQDRTHLNTDWTFQGFPIVRLENRTLKVDVVPALGGKIWSLEHRPSQREFLWHHPRHRLRSLPLGASYDDHFFGGFDELLPNDLPERVHGESLVDHGELWTTPLSARIELERLILEGQLPITPLHYRKSLLLHQDGLLLEYHLRNLGRRPLDLLWKMHPALRISPGTQILVPGRIAQVADRQWSRVKDVDQFSWPDRPSLHAVPAMDGTTEFLYLRDLTEGSCALRHPGEGWGFTMTFPKEIFTSVWIFASFAGWRNLEMLILEPCTTPQLSLAQSATEGRCLRLAPGASVEAAVEIRVSGSLRAD